MFVLCVCCCVVGFFFPFYLLFQRLAHREISNYGIEIPLCQHLQGIIQKKQKNRLLGCMQYACVNISVCCSHIIFLLKVPVGIKVLCLEGALGYLLVDGFSKFVGISNYSLPM